MSRVKSRESYDNDDDAAGGDAGTQWPPPIDEKVIFVVEWWNWVDGPEVPESYTERVLPHESAEVAGR